MRSFLLPFVLLSLGLVASSDPILSRSTVHERRSHVPLGWSLARKHDASAVVPLRFALAQSNIENIEEYLYDVSHPSSPNFGKHWSAAKVASTFAPSSESVDAVRGWLIESGIESHRIQHSPSGGWLELTATVQEAEDLLHTTYNVYGHETGAEHVACESYHLPEHLVPHVDFVTPTVHFDAKLSKRSDSLSGPPLKSVGLPGFGNIPKTVEAILDPTSLGQVATCDKYTTPTCLRALYDFWYTPKSKNNSYGIVEYSPNVYLQSDINLFAKTFDKTLVGKSPLGKFIDGAKLSKNASFNNNGESDLDLQYAMTLATVEQPVTLFQVGDLVEGASFNNFLDAIDGSYCKFMGGDDQTQDGIYPDPATGGYKGPEACGTVKPTNVISTSYGYNEADLTPFYAARQCAEYAKLGMMGITVIYSSGDNGVAGNNELCLNPNDSQSKDGKTFNPTFPSTCPWVTSVGATQVVSGKTVYDPESACEKVIRSGGGFSNYFGLPKYQEEAVTTYLKDYPPSYSSSVYNATGKSRAYPDLSANGANYVVAVDGNLTLVYGTSAAAPVVGAMLAMVNDARLAEGKKTIGFINPLIYSANFSAGFHDITNGTNAGCGTTGFSTSRGWDPVTGLGTPKFSVLLAKWLAMP